MTNPAPVASETATGAGPPELSIVLIVRHPDETPDAVLAALANETVGTSVETILVDGRPDTPSLKGPLPSRLVRLERPRMNMPRLKAEGAGAASGPCVAFLEPKGVPVQGWLRAALGATAAHPGAAIGGAVTAGLDGGAADRATYFFEYSAFSLSALATGKTSDLPGNNMVLPLDLLRDRCRDILAAEGLNKPFCQARLTGGGVAIVMVPGMEVQMRTRYRLGSLLVSRLRYGRCFGGTRAALAAPSKRWLYRLAAPLVPALLLRRHLGTAMRAGPDRPDAGTLAALAALCLAWSAGEAAGSWAGPGAACDALF